MNEIMSMGQLRFRGASAREVFGLIEHDDSYSCAVSSEQWEFLDVYPKTVEARELLIKICETQGKEPT